MFYQVVAVVFLVVVVVLPAVAVAVAMVPELVVLVCLHQSSNLGGACALGGDKT